MSSSEPRFNGHDVRVVMIDGAPWWVAADVRRILGVAQSGSNFSFLSSDEVRPIPRGLASGKGMAQALVLSESGLYKFMLRSDKPEARAFHAPLARQDWVTRVVLPAIRKDGAYIMGEDKVEFSIVTWGAAVAHFRGHNITSEEWLCTGFHGIQ
ncbi:MULTISPECIES: BRO-N domain-containing protein [unclassified Xanthobacter]|uniref:BRO-N domain-containing protein n=1 Tax=unclassified Xanthobacter TaxID=2623496 RepID=UPI001EDD628A|nr:MULTISPECIES: BRO family protein [unclassified Xanthobacter]